METKFTKGEWKAVNKGKHWNNSEIDNWEIQYSEDGECVVDHVYEEADAHLIACAPELYKELESILKQYGGSIGDVASVRIIDLLAKARGES